MAGGRFCCAATRCTTQLTDTFKLFPCPNSTFVFISFGGGRRSGLHLWPANASLLLFTPFKNCSDCGHCGRLNMKIFPQRCKYPKECPKSPAAFSAGIIGHYAFNKRQWKVLARCEAREASEFIIKGINFFCFSRISLNVNKRSCLWGHKLARPPSGILSIFLIISTSSTTEHIFINICFVPHVFTKP